MEYVYGMMRIHAKNLKKFLFLIIFIIILTGCVQEKYMLTYENSAYRIKYPKEWSKQEFMDTGVIFTSPKENTSDNFRENLHIIVQDLSSNPVTLDEYTNESIEKILESVPNVNILKSEKTIVSSNPAYMVIYTGNQEDYHLKWMQIWTLKENKAFIITYTAEEESYDNFLNIIEEMINSFEVI